MTDLDLEFARFEAEIAAAEAKTKEAAKPASHVPPKLPPPSAPPPAPVRAKVPPPPNPPPQPSPRQVQLPTMHSSASAVRPAAPMAGPLAGPAPGPIPSPTAVQPAAPQQPQTAPRPVGGFSGAIMRPSTQRPTMPIAPANGAAVGLPGPPAPGGAPGMPPPPAFGQTTASMHPMAGYPPGPPAAGTLPGPPLNAAGYPAAVPAPPLMPGEPGGPAAGSAGAQTYYSAGPVAPPAPPSAPPDPPKKEAPKPAIPRLAGGEKWWDPTLAEWPENDYRIFVGDLGNEVNDEVLAKAFSKYSSMAKAKIVRDKRTNKSRGYGFVSLLDALEGARAIREMNGKYIGNRPCKLRKSTWDERNDEAKLNRLKKKNKNKKHIS